MRQQGHGAGGCGSISSEGSRSGGRRQVHWQFSRSRRQHVHREANMPRRRQVHKGMWVGAVGLGGSRSRKNKAQEATVYK
jgi:hypothetical protein